MNEKAQLLLDFFDKLRPAVKPPAFCPVSLPANGQLALGYAGLIA